MITTLNDFVARCMFATNDDIYNMFEFDCTDSVRDEVYALADSDACEPFRCAMHKMGFVNY